MKKYPCCGFVPTPTNRQLLNRYKREFGDIPVMAMINRRWLGDVDETDIAAVEAALLRFFGVACRDDLTRLLNLPAREFFCEIVEA